jgi:hypothetical protein
VTFRDTRGQQHHLLRAETYDEAVSEESTELSRRGRDNAGRRLRGELAGLPAGFDLDARSSSIVAPRDGSDRLVKAILQACADRRHAHALTVRSALASDLLGEVVAGWLGTLPPDPELVLHFNRSDVIGIARMSREAFHKSWFALLRWNRNGIFVATTDLESGLLLDVDDDSGTYETATWP